MVIRWSKQLVGEEVLHPPLGGSSTAIVARLLLVATFFDDEVGPEEGWRGSRQLTRSDRFSWDEQGLHVSHNMLRMVRTTAAEVEA